MEVDCGFEVLDIPESAGSSLDGHDFAVQALSHSISDGVPAVGQNIIQALMDHQVTSGGKKFADREQNYVVLRNTELYDTHGSVQGLRGEH